MGHWSRVWTGGVLLLAVLLSGGCGSSDAQPRWTVWVDGNWNQQPATRQDLGYTFSIEVRSYDTGNQPCPSWSAAMHLRVNGQEETPAVDAVGCLDTQLTLGPLLQVDPITVDVLDGASVVAHAVFDDVAPGTKATVVSPAGGTFQGGDEIIVLPPPELPSGYADFGIFFPLDTDTWSPKGTAVTAERLADGVHAIAPALSGQVAAVFQGSFSSPSATISCTGFAVCTAVASNVLGPVFLVGAP